MVAIPQHKKKFSKNNGSGSKFNRGGNKSFDKSRNGNKFGKRPPKSFKPKIVEIVPHQKFENIYILRGKEDNLLTKNLVPGISVYNEKRMTQVFEEEKIEYRVWNPYRSKLGAGIVSGCDDIFIKPGSKVLYLGAASGTTVSHVSDIIGKEGTVYAVEFSQRSGRDLVNLAKKRSNIIPIIEDARQPHKYRMLVPIVDCIISDVAQPDQTRIVGLNAQYFLKNKGGVMISIKANCVDSTLAPETIFAQEVNVMRKEQIKPKEQVSLEPFENDHAMLVGIYRPQ